jgi:hypothetical protein
MRETDERYLQFEKVWTPEANPVAPLLQTYISTPPSPDARGQPDSDSLKSIVITPSKGSASSIHPLLG